MRTENPGPGSALDRLRIPFDRARGWVATRPTTFRRVLLGGGVALVLAGGVYLSLPADPTPWVLLEDGRRFPGGEAAAIRKALTAEGIPYQLDDRGPIGVPIDRLADARSALTKHKVDFDSVGRIFDRARTPNILDANPRDTREAARGQILEAMIEGLDQIESATVDITRERSRDAFRTGDDVAGSVFVKARGGRRLRLGTIDKIRNFLKLVPDLEPDAVTLVDSDGNRYLTANEPDVTARSLARARQEELSQDIASTLDWIKGVRVVVRLDPAPVVEPARPPAPAVEPLAPVPEAIAVASVALAAPAATDLPPPGAPNRPIALEPEPTIEPEPIAEAAPPAPMPVDEAPAPAPVPEPAPGKAWIWVQVPRSFYLRDFRAAHREPTPEDLQAHRDKTDALIRTAVAAKLGPGEYTDPKIDIIPDDPTPPRAEVVEVAQAGHRPVSWMVPAGAAAAASALAVAALFRALAARRPAPARGVSSSRLRYELAAAAAGPGPSERVRHLVRTNPEAAAGVLQRWIGRGGDAG